MYMCNIYLSGFRFAPALSISSTHPYSRPKESERAEYTQRTSSEHTSVNAMLSRLTHLFAQRIHACHPAHRQTIFTQTRLKCECHCNTYRNCIVCDKPESELRIHIYALSSVRLCEGHKIWISDLIWRSIAFKLVLFSVWRMEFFFAAFLFCRKIWDCWPFSYE